MQQQSAGMRSFKIKTKIDVNDDHEIFATKFQSYFVMFSYSGLVYILIWGSDLLLGSDSLAIFKSEMWKATRYVDILGVILKFSRT